jgi:hypothetical protein
VAPAAAVELELEVELPQPLTRHAAASAHRMTGVLTLLIEGLYEGAPDEQDRDDGCSHSRGERHGGHEQAKANRATTHDATRSV